MKTKHIKGITAASLAAGLLAAPLANAAPSVAPLTGGLHTFNPGVAPGPVTVERYKSTAVRLTNSGLPPTSDANLNSAPSLSTANWPVVFTDANSNDTIDVGETGIESLAWILNSTLDGGSPITQTFWDSAGDGSATYDSKIWFDFELTVKATSSKADGASPFGLTWDYTGGTIRMYVDNDGTGGGLDRDVHLATFDVTGVDGTISAGSAVTNLNVFGDKSFMKAGVFKVGATDLSLVDVVFGFSLHNAFSVGTVDCSGSMGGSDICMVILNTNSSLGEPVGPANTNQEFLITVPEPATLGLLGLGFMGLGAASRRRRRQA